MEMACQKDTIINHEFRPATVAFCQSTPGLDEKCDPDGNFLCPCHDGLFCVNPNDKDHHYSSRALSDFDPHKQVKNYANCLCNHSSSPRCHYTPKVGSSNSSFWNHQHAPRCQRSRPSMIHQINTPRLPSLKHQATEATGKAVKQTEVLT